MVGLAVVLTTAFWWSLWIGYMLVNAAYQTEMAKKRKNLDA